MQTRNNSFWYIGSLCLATLTFPFIYILPNVWPSGDDYSYAVHGLMSGEYFDHVISDWFTWNGRYSSNFLVMANPISFDAFWLYRITPLVFLCLHFLFLYFALKNLILKSIGLSHLLSKTQLWFLSALFESLYLCVMPDISEGFYWFTGAATYLAPLIFTPFYIGFILKLWNSETAYLTPMIVIIPLQALLNGSNEIFMLYLTLAHVILVGISVLKNQKRFKQFGLLLCSQILFASLVFFAPGNEIRSAYFEGKHDAIHTIINGTMNTGRFTIWFFAHPFIIVTLIFLTKWNPLSAQKKKLPTWVWSLLFLIPLFIACAGPVWTTGIIGQHRTVNFAHYFMLLIVFAYSLFEYGKPHQIVQKYLSFINPKVLLFILMVSFVFTGNLPLVSKDLVTGKAAAYHAENKEREFIIINTKANNGQDIHAPFLQHKPQSIYNTNYDLGPTRDHWVNDAIMRYYGRKQEGVGICGF